MNLKDIKNLINEEGGKLIIADDNGPALVIMSFSDYKKKRNSDLNPAIIDDPIEQLPIIKEVSVEEKKGSFGVDDLPF